MRGGVIGIKTPQQARHVAHNRARRSGHDLAPFARQPYGWSALCRVCCAEAKVILMPTIGRHALDGRALSHPCDRAAQP